MLRMLDAGATDAEVCAAVGCDRSVLYSYLRRDPSFATPKKAAKEHADARVEKSLYQRANGYDVEEKVVEGVPGPDGKIITQTVRIVKKHVAPDTASAIFWLKNRKPQDWRDKREMVVSGVESLGDLLGAAQEKA